MKKVLFSAIALTLSVSMLAVPAFAETTDAIEKPLSAAMMLSSVSIAGASAVQKSTPQAGIAHRSEQPFQIPLSNRIVEYHMNVDYAAESRQLKGQQTITWKNPGMKPVKELYLHLYPNAFSSTRTTFMTESNDERHGDDTKPVSFGGMDLLEVKTMNGIDLTNRISFIQPDDNNKADHTLVKLTLPQPVAPGKDITFQTKFLVRLPEIMARMGYSDDFVMAAQWFPKLAVYETAGTRERTEEGWNLHQYHYNSEFYADFGIYDVKITVPSNYKVAATGLPTKPQMDENGKSTFQFYAEDVHDFAWSASPDFKFFEDTFSAPNIPDVSIKLYLDPKHESLKNRYIHAAKKALTRFNEWYGSYPYTTLSIVVPPSEADGACCMEYPTLVTNEEAVDDSPDLELERTLAHEIAHQYWYGLVASNEFEEAWLDESFASYAEDKFMEAEFGFKPNPALESSYIKSPAPLNLNAWDYKNREQYVDNVYTRGKLVLLEIEKQIGKSTMHQIMKTYFQKWKFQHPTTSDFQHVVEEVTGTNWDDFFCQYVYGNKMIDYAEH